METLNLPVAASALTPLIRDVVQEVLRHQTSLDNKLSDKLAYAEPEAARLLGLKPHQLRDARLGGKVGHTRITGNRVRYTPEDLRQYLQVHHTDPTES